ncbi:MAG: flagellar protein FlaG [Desulfobacteraceae bacterium Eth-SRB2]|nr:MAG: flagellar protein FlaG [Desulfobacteraceae bacterium Eth-SRB2]
MRVEPITVSGKNEAPPVQARLPAEQATNPKDKEVQQPVKSVDLPDLEELVADVQKNLNIMHNVDLQFSVHKASGQMMITVFDESTGKVVREIPSSEILELAAKMDEMVGMMFDQKG